MNRTKARARQRLLPFLERSKARERTFKRAILGLTAVVLAGMVGGTTAGRYAVQVLPVEAKRSAMRLIGLEPSRSEADAIWRLKRRRGMLQAREVFRHSFAEANPATRDLLTAAGMTPDDAVIRWGNYDWTLVLSSKVFEPDDKGRSYRLLPSTRSIWLKGVELQRDLVGFFLVPDTGQVREAARRAGVGLVDESAQATNAWGYRGPLPDGNAALRGLVLGDSFMQGMFLGEEETPPACLRRSLESRLKVAVSVLNTGHLGYSPEQYYSTLDDALSRFRPDFVVVSLFANDFGEGWAVVEGRGDWGEARHWLGKIQQRCHLESIPCFIVPAPFEAQVARVRREYQYPARITDVSNSLGPFYCNPIEDFIDEHLKTQTPDDRQRQKSPLFNGRLSDGHFSAKGAEVWGNAVGRRLALTLKPKLRNPG